MAKKTNSQGFSLIAGIVIVLAIAAIGLGGWYVWDKNQKDDTNKSDKTSQNNQNENEEEEESDQSEDRKYLVIKEWDIRITLPEELEGDISYFLNDRAERDFGGPLLVDFVSKTFSEGGLKCAEVDNTPRSLLSIYREVDGEGGETLDPQPFKRLGNTRYYLTEPGCAEAIERAGSSEDRLLLTSLREAIVSSLENYSE